MVESQPEFPSLVQFTACGLSDEHSLKRLFLYSANSVLSTSKPVAGVVVKTIVKTEMPICVAPKITSAPHATHLAIVRHRLLNILGKDTQYYCRPEKVPQRCCRSINLSYDPTYLLTFHAR